MPGRHFVAGKSRFSDGGRIGQLRATRAGGYCDCAQSACLYMADDAAHTVKHDGHASGNHIRMRGRRTFVGNMHKVDAGHTSQQLARQVARAHIARRGIAAFRRVGGGKSQHVLDRFHRQFWMCHQYLWKACGLRHRRQVLLRVVGECRHHNGIERQGRRSQQQRATIGRGFCDDRGGDYRAAAAPVFDHDLLPPFFRELLRDDAALRVGGPACGVGDDKAWGFAAGWGLAVRRASQRNAERQQRWCAQRRHRSIAPLQRSSS